MDISYESYNLKRYENRISNTEFFYSLSSDNTLLKDFREYYLNNIESLKFLKYDSLIVDINLLSTLKKKHHDLVLLSLRSNFNNSTRQLKNLGIYKLFKQIHFLQHAELNPKTEKLKKIVESESRCIFIGDSDKDYMAAKMSGVKFKGVNTGLFKGSEMPSAEKNVNELIDAILESGKI